MRGLGWTDGAYALINQTLVLNPLAPYLPELEFQKALLLQDQKKNDEAQALFQKVFKDYPNHPISDQARRNLK